MMLKPGIRSTYLPSNSERVIKPFLGGKITGNLPQLMDCRGAQS